MARKIYSTARSTVSGPYSHGVDAGELIFLSGQTAKNSTGDNKDVKDIAGQTEECFKSLLSVLEAGNLSAENVVKVNVYLTDMKDFPEMNKVYEKQFSKPYPARTCVAVYQLPLGADVEIELIAKRP